jgi:two-component system response regulator TctD
MMKRTDESVPRGDGMVVDHIDVELLRWPDEAERAAELAGRGRPCLLLVAADAEPPTDWDRLTDWIRVPADDLDLWTRIAALQWRSRMRSMPHLDAADLLWRGDEWVALSPIERAVLGAFLEAPGIVVTRRQLGAAGWPNGVPGPRAVDVYVKRLRRRVAGFGLQIHTVRSRGYLLEIEGAVHDGAGAGPQAPQHR